jgi:hypothetical protein
MTGRGGEEKNSQPPPGIEPENPDRPARSPALYRLSYHSSQTGLGYGQVAVIGTYIH